MLVVLQFNWYIIKSKEGTFLSLEHIIKLEIGYLCIKPTTKSLDTHTHTHTHMHRVSHSLSLKTFYSGPHPTN